VILIPLNLNSLFSKEFKYYDLSEKYNYEIKTWKKKDTNMVLHEFNKIQVTIINKSDTNKIQKIIVKPETLFGDAYTKRSDVVSYITGKNKKREITDNDFGDFIVADFNFDGLEDIAIKWETGGNGGPLYEFYIQDSTGTFHKDKFLTSKVKFFPGKIDKANKTLKTYVHANVYGVNEWVYKLDALTGKWKLIKCNELWKKGLKK